MPYDDDSPNGTYRTFHCREDAPGLCVSTRVFLSLSLLFACKEEEEEEPGMLPLWCVPWNLVSSRHKITRTVGVVCLSARLLVHALAFFFLFLPFLYSSSQSLFVYVMMMNNTHTHTLHSVSDFSLFIHQQNKDVKDFLRFSVLWSR